MHKKLEEGTNVFKYYKHLKNNMKINICLINLLQDGESAIDDGNDESVIPNMGTGYIASSLEANGYNADIFDCNLMGIDLESVSKLIVEGRYTIIGIASFAYNVNYMNQLVNNVKKGLPDSFIYIGAYYATLNYEYALYANKNIDCCMIGEGEITTVELVKALENNQNWESIPGIAYLKNNRVVKTEKRKMIENLDYIPFPKRPLIKRNTTSLLTSRGCYGKCIYCCLIDFTNTCIGSHIRYRSVSNVLEEIEELVLNRGVKFLQINDDNFLIGSEKRKKWLFEFYTELKKREYKINFFIYARANDIVRQKEILEKLKEVGLQQVFIGIESFVQRQLDFYNKKVDKKTNIEAFCTLAQLRIPIIMGFLMFEPNTKLEEIIENLETLKELEFQKYLWHDHMLISSYPPVIPYTGTPIYNYLLKNKLFVNNSVGYEFSDNRVAYFYHSVICKWNKTIFPYINEVNNGIKIYKNSPDMFEKYKQKKQKILKIDVEFMLQASKTIRDDRYEILADVVKKYEVLLNKQINI